MKKREITATGTINNNGGLAMYMGELNEFFKGWKGSRIIARFIVASPGTSEALKGYYFNYVVPTFKHAIWEAGERLTEDDVCGNFPRLCTLNGSTRKRGYIPTICAPWRIYQTPS